VFWIDVVGMSSVSSSIPPMSAPSMGMFVPDCAAASVYPVGCWSQSSGVCRRSLRPLSVL
jgi:hypothetical protein